MPIYKYVSKKSITYLIWEIQETENELLELSTLSQSEKTEFSKINNDDRKLQWLAVRVALKNIIENSENEYYGLCKTNQGKPYSIDNQFYISLSHCNKYVMAAMSSISPIGIDIQKFEKNLDIVKTKFLSNQELLYNDLNIPKLCILWSAKEAVFKLFSPAKISLKNDILIQDFNLEDYKTENNYLKASCKEKKIFIRYEIFEEYIICYSINISHEGATAE